MPRKGGKALEPSGNRGISMAFVPWIEKYRPKTLSEVAGNPEITARLRAFVKKGELPHLLFSGKPGVGKSTCALALATDLFGKQVEESFLELNASDERGIQIVRGKIKDFARTLSLDEVPFKIIFLDEADSLTPEAQQALRRTMEVYSSNTRFILSCNYSSRIIEPIQSRCAVFRFGNLSGKELEEIIERIAKAEKLSLDGGAVKAIIYASDGDARKATNILQGASILGEKVTEAEVFKVSSLAKPKEVREIIRLAMESKFSQARTKLHLLMTEYGLSGEDVLSQIYKEVASAEMDDKKRVLLIDKIGEADYRISEGADEVVQLEALLAQMAMIKQ